MGMEEKRWRRMGRKVGLKGEVGEKKDRRKGEKNDEGIQVKILTDIVFGVGDCLLVVEVLGQQEGGLLQPQQEGGGGGAVLRGP